MVKDRVAQTAKKDLGGWPGPLKASGPRVLAALLLSFGLCLLACSSKKQSDPAVSSDGFDFSGLWRGGTGSSGPLGYPLPPDGLTASVNYGVVTLSWKMPKIYKTSALKIGYRIFRKKTPDAGAQLFDFSSTVGLDWTLDVGKVVTANSCTADGSCSFSDSIGGPVVVAYSVIAYWDITDFNSNRSVNVDVATLTKQTPVNYDYPVGFMNTRPLYLIGNVVDKFDRRPDQSIFNFQATEAPWYQLDASQSQATRSSWATLADPIVVGMSDDGLTALLPDSGYSRSMYLTRGKMDQCDQFASQDQSLCYSTLLAKSFVSDYASGQQANTVGLGFAANPLETSRKFLTKRTSLQTSDSGVQYIFVSDEQRILIRSVDIYPCFSDPGEVASVAAGIGPEGKCGFQWSIGTYSPRQRCALRADGTAAVGETDCSDADAAYSMADTTSPSDHSLRKPGAPIIVGKHLYIPDSGNARILRLANFEKALKSCGRLLPAGSTVANDFCHFDEVVGQYGATPEDAAKFTARSCIKGGERGGKDGALGVAQNVPFVDPTGQTGSGGAACRLDMVTDMVAGQAVGRRSRLAGDFKDESSSMMSADTGLLAGITKRLFRAPLEMKYDATTGYLYVMDTGFTITQSAASPDVAMLPPRIMVWQKDPFSFQKCVPTDPAATVPSCAIDQNNVCSGVGCIDRQCSAAECDATFFFGQQAALYGFPYQSGQTLGVDITPSGYYPLASFDISSNGGQKGLWAVAGQDARVYHWKDISQTASPDVHNQKSTTDNVDPTFRNLNFVGINLDVHNGEIITWDSSQNIGIVWMGVESAPPTAP